MNDYFVGFFIGCVLIVLGAGGYLMVSENFKFDVCNKNLPIALVDVQIHTFAENLYDDSEIFFDYNIYNYGDAEANNVKVQCDLYDVNNNLIISVTDSFGNLASKSWELGEVVTNNFPSDDDAEFIPLCFIKSCENCKILYKEIEEVKEIYEWGNL